MSYIEWAFCGGEVDTESNQSLYPVLGGYLGLVSSGLSVVGCIEDIGQWEEWPVGGRVEHGSPSTSSVATSPVSTDQDSTPELVNELEEFPGRHLS